MFLDEKTEEWKPTTFLFRLHMSDYIPLTHEDLRNQLLVPIVSVKMLSKLQPLRIVQEAAERLFLPLHSHKALLRRIFVFFKKQRRNIIPHGIRGQIDSSSQGATDEVVRPVPLC